MRKWTVRVLIGAICAAVALPASAVEPTEEAATAYNAYVEAFKNEDTAAAQEHLKAAIAAQPEWATPHLAMGQLCIQQKKFKTAGTHLETATELDPAEATGFLYLGNAYVEQNLPSKAYPALQKALSLDSSLVEAHKLMAMAYYEDGDYAAARDHYTRYTTVETGDAVAFLRLGDANKQLKNTKSAVKAYKAAIKANPKLFAAHYNLGNLYLGRQDFADAEEAFASAIKIRPKDVKAHFNLAIAIHSQARLEEALAAYQRVVQVGGNRSSAKRTVEQAKATIQGLKQQIDAGGG
jgi:cytochrome c-type biogenesis protein CcmH/NrfG